MATISKSVDRSLGNTGNVPGDPPKRQPRQPTYKRPDDSEYTIRHITRLFAVRQCLFETSPVNRPMSTNNRVYMRASLKPKHGGNELSGQRLPAPPVASRASSKPALKTKWFINAKITFREGPSLSQRPQLNRAPAPSTRASTLPPGSNLGGRDSCSRRRPKVDAARSLPPP